MGKIVLQKGQMALSFVLLTGGIFVLIGVTLSLFLLTSIRSAYALEAANRALAAASAGAEDGLLQLVRNKDFSSPSYSISVGSSTATVAVTQNSPSAGKVTIVASSTVARSIRSLEVIASVVSSTGEVSVISWRQP